MPYRVIYLKSGLFSSRLFSDQSGAEEFAKKVKVVLVQPANEAIPEQFINDPNSPRQTLYRTKKSVHTNLCSCGQRTKLISNEYCSVCDGTEDTVARIHRMYRRKPMER